MNSPYRTPEEPPSAWSSWNEEWERARIEAAHAEKRASLAERERLLRPSAPVRLWRWLLSLVR